MLARVGQGTGRALDIPCGEGALTATLVAAGFSVTSADVAPERFRVPDHTAERVDFDEGLPYPDAAFALVVCAEGIEHAENPYRLMRELARVLQPGGRLVLSTPNPLNLASRLRAFLTGFSDVSPRPIRHDEPLLSAHHISPMRLQFLELMLRRNQLELVSLTANRLRTSALLIGALVLPLSGWPRAGRSARGTARRPCPASMRASRGCCCHRRPCSAGSSSSRPPGRPDAAQLSSGRWSGRRC